MIIGNVIGGFVKNPNRMTFKDINGNVFTAILTDEIINVTATADDLRKDTIAITKEGLTVGTKEIPAYHTIEGYRLITPGSKVIIPNVNPDIDSYDYTKMQAMICLFNTKASDSVYVEKVVINDNVYAVKSTDIISTVVKNHDNKTIDLGITNDTDSNWYVRFFMYKEIE